MERVAGRRCARGPPRCEICLEEDCEALTLEGEALELEDPKIIRKMALACKTKYDWAIDPGEGPFYQIAPRRVLAYAEASFPDSAGDCRIHSSTTARLGTVAYRKSLERASRRAETAAPGVCSHEGECSCGKSGVRANTRRSRRVIHALQPATPANCRLWRGGFNFPRRSTARLSPSFRRCFPRPRPAAPPNARPSSQ